MRFSPDRLSPGIAIVGLLYAMPLILWIATMPEIHAGNLAIFFRSLAKICAISAMISFALAPLMNIKLVVIDKLFNGLDNAHRLHKLIGKAGLFLSIAHPLFLSLMVLADGRTKLSYIWSPTRPVVLFGLLAVTGTIISLLLTYWIKMRHQKWITIHRFLGWMLLLAIIHLLYSRGDVYSSKALYSYLLIISMFGFMAFLYTSVLHRALGRFYEYELVEINKLNDNVCELVLKPLDIKMSYRAGQYAYMRLQSDIVDQEPHPFSFATNDNGPYIRFGIKALGDYTSQLVNLKPGTKAYLEGPFGGFTYLKSSSSTQIWIAGGVGITPFLSMARSIPKNIGKKIILIYGFRDFDDAVFLKELKEIQKLRKDIFEVYIASEKLNGYVDLDKIKSVAQDYTSADYLICGPPAMMASVKKVLNDNGVSQNKIQTEEFNY